MEASSSMYLFSTSDGACASTSRKTHFSVPASPGSLCAQAPPLGLAVVGGRGAPVVEPLELCACRLCLGEMPRSCAVFRTTRC